MTTGIIGFGTNLENVNPKAYRLFLRSKNIDHAGHLGLSYSYYCKCSEIYSTRKYIKEVENEKRRAVAGAKRRARREGRAA